MSVLDQLKRQSSAEDFFSLLGVPYDPSVLNVARLHILRRMGEYLRRQDLEGLDDAALMVACREYLAKAYADFVASSPLDQRVFKVLKDAVRPKRGAFVPLSALTNEG